MDLLRKLFGSKQVRSTSAEKEIQRPFKIKRSPFKTSEKEFEVLKIEYRWDKYTRKLIQEPEWFHFKYYNTLEAAQDAVRDFRNSWYDKVYRDYPAMTIGVENEKKYPHIRPTITINRYKVARRDDI